MSANIRPPECYLDLNHASSPYEPDAHYARKHTTSWVGYKVHLSETCEPGELHLITNVETTPGPIDDGDVTESIHASLANNNLLPSKHIVDTGYLDAELLVTTQDQHQVDLLGPTRVNHRWQAKEAKGFAAADGCGRLAEPVSDLP